MIVKVLDFATQEEIASFSYKEGAKTDMQAVLREIKKRQETEDILKLGETGIADLGICSWFDTKFGFSSVSADEAVSVLHTGKNSMVIGSGNQIKEPAEVTIKGKATGKKIAVIASYEGYVLNAGKKSYNIFGGAHDAYFSKITTRNVKFATKGSARRFATVKAVIKYVSENRDTFEYMVKQYGYSFSVETASEAFEATAKVNQADMDAVNGLLEQINNVSAVEDTVDTSLNPEEEAVRRMRKLGLDTGMVVFPFAKGSKIFQSEAGGILYDPDENCKKAMEKVKEYGGLPYHVCVSNTEFGKLYAVLYVSKTREDWKVEGPGRDGTVAAYVYNADDDNCSEFGDIQVQTANGGLVRTA